MSQLPLHLRNAPKSVRVGCYDIAIEIMNDNDADVAGVMGFIIPNRQVIRLRANAPAQQTANTFIHEVMHAIHYVYGVGDDDDEEMFTTQSANGLCAFWQDNPKACQWWQRLLTRDPL